MTDLATLNCARSCVRATPICFPVFASARCAAAPLSSILTLPPGHSVSPLDTSPFLKVISFFAPAPPSEARAASEAATQTHIAAVVDRNGDIGRPFQLV